MAYEKNLKINFLDTSAIVPLLFYPDILEEGSHALAKFYNENLLFYTLDLCIGEALNIIKQKYFFKKKKQLNFDGYRIIINRLINTTKEANGSRLHICKIDLYENNAILNFALKIIKKYETDFVDSCLIAYIKNNPKIGSQLITGDQKLYEIALAENVSCINYRVDNQQPETTQIK